MLSVLCHYSANNVFAITGNKKHLVSPVDMFSLPKDVSQLLRPSGCKLTYRRLEDGNYGLAVNEVPRNTFGTLEVLFVADDTHRHILDNLAIVIADNLPSFEEWFADLFYLEKGIRCKGDRLLAWLDRMDGAVPCNGFLPFYLCSFHRKGAVMLQVLSETSRETADGVTFVRIAELLGNTNQANPQLPTQGTGKLKLSNPYKPKPTTPQQNPTQQPIPLPPTIPPEDKPSRKPSLLTISLVLNVLLSLLVAWLLVVCP